MLAAPNQTIAQPDLGRLKAASERVSSAAQRVAAFIERFMGVDTVGGREAASGGAVAPPPTYRNDLNSLFEQIDYLEEVARTLDDIG